MTNTFPFTPAIWSYGIAAIIFLAFAARMLLGWRGGARATVLFVAVIASAAWAGLVWVALGSTSIRWWRIATTIDSFRVGTWLIFMTLLLESWRNDSHGRSLLKGAAGYLAVPLLLLISGTLIGSTPPWAEASSGNDNQLTFYVWLGASVFGLALTEQLYRRSPPNRRWAIKPLVIGLAGMFALDLLIYSGAVLLHHVDPAMWAARGIACAVVIFFVGVATARNTTWTVARA